MVERHFGPIPAEPGDPARRPTPIDPIIGAEVRETCPIRCRCRGSTRRTACRPSGPMASTRSRSRSTCSVQAARRASIAARAGAARRAGRDHLRLPDHRRRGIFTLWVTARPGWPTKRWRPPAGGGRPARHRRPERRRAGAGPQPACLRHRRVEPGAHQRAGRSARCTPASSMSRSGSTPRSPLRAVDAGRVRDAMATLRADNRVTLTYFPAESAGRHDHHRPDAAAAGCPAPVSLPGFPAPSAGERPERLDRSAPRIASSSASTCWSTPAPRPRTSRRAASPR